MVADREGAWYAILVPPVIQMCYVSVQDGNKHFRNDLSSFCWLRILAYYEILPPFKLKIPWVFCCCLSDIPYRRRWRPLIIYVCVCLCMCVCICVDYGVFRLGWVIDEPIEKRWLVKLMYVYYMWAAKLNLKSWRKIDLNDFSNIR